MKIACILDEFSYNCFKYEGEFFYLEKYTWKEQLIKEKPSLLFVESFWRGLLNDWGNILASGKEENLAEFLHLLEYCKVNGIKTVFWNKEDPVSFDRFISIAKLFDYIFTTDETSIEKYELITGKKNVWVLPFAAQPRIHNPLNVEYDSTFKTVFAGSWYPNYFMRQEEMKLLFNGSINHNLVIYDRNYKENKKNFPIIYDKFVYGGLSYSEMLSEYKNSTVVLNVNTVRESKNMFARRVYEVLACSRIVASAYSKGIHIKFNKFVKIVENSDDLQRFLQRILNNPYEKRLLGVLGMHEVYSKHLYEHRWQEILEKIGIKMISKKTNKINVFSKCDSEFELKEIYDQFSSQLYENKCLYIISDNLEGREEENLKVLSNEKLVNLKLNPEEYVTFMDRDYKYMEEYLNDLYYGMKYSIYPIVSKVSYWVNPEAGENIINVHKENKELNINDLNPNSFLTEVSNINNFTEFLSEIVTNKNLDFLRFIKSDKFTSLNSLFFYKKNNVEVNNLRFSPNMRNLIDNDSFDFEDYQKKLNNLVKSYSPEYIGVNNIIFNEIPKDIKNIYIYGAGEHTKNLLKVLKYKEKVVAIFDRNPNLSGMLLDGIEVLGLNKLSGINMENSKIIISSFEFEREIVTDLVGEFHISKDVIVTIYEENERFTNEIYKELYSEYKYECEKLLEI